MRNKGQVNKRSTQKNIWGCIQYIVETSELQWTDWNDYKLNKSAFGYITTIMFNTSSDLCINLHYLFTRVHTILFKANIVVSSLTLCQLFTEYSHAVVRLPHHN